MTRIALVGMACRYPDATDPKELFDNAIAGRRAFRRLPDVRMRLEDYWDPDPGTPDRFYAREAAVIDSYEFDRVAYRVAGSTYRSTDLTHWLALDIAAGALADAGFPMAEGLPRDRTGVIVGNTLTGEFSRANQLRLRWPYVQRTISAVLREHSFDDDEVGVLIDDLERAYKSPFPLIDEDTLAGGLSNTIAGRICNHFDLKGGGYTVDGACSSSLLSVATACKALVDGELDVAVAGGVDLSIDPFEIIGFAKTGALATGEMRVYDRGSNGFWPGEGCGMVVLMREDDARDGGHRIYASVTGWGISSDGKGGITRPETRGYHLALDRAYARAGFGIDTVPLFEGHGTGTKVGDSNELTALNENRLAADPTARPAAISSIKAMIGHTKAAAGIAGLIKASMALRNEVLPPAVGCVDPHEIFAADQTSLRVLHKAEPWPDGQPLRAGVTAMGFGGINTHLVLDKEPARRVRYSARIDAIATGSQDAELLAFDALTPQELRERLDRAARFVPEISYAQLGDLAATLHGELRDLTWRAAVVVRSPAEASERLAAVMAAIDAGETWLFADEGQTSFGQVGEGRIGFLYPGQGSGRGVSGGALRRRFAEADEAYRRAALPAGGDTVATEVAQPRIVTGSIAGQQVLTALGIEAQVALGHSLGELSALHWAGAMDAEALLRLAERRGRTMAEHSSSGTMASLSTGAERAEQLIAGLPLVVAGHNGPAQTVIAGTAEAVEEACRRAEEASVGAARLAVSHAFHSPLVAEAAGAFGELLREERFREVGRKVVSTVTGEPLDADTDLAALLERQITEPVLFAEAVALAAKDVDLLVEVGPGRVLSGLAGAVVDVPAVPLDTDDESSRGLLRVVAAAFVVGATNIEPALFQGRLLRPLAVGASFDFFQSPCEQAPEVPAHRPAGPNGAEPAPSGEADEAQTAGGDVEVPEMLRQIVAERAELPSELVNMDSRLLDDLHLSSITVGQVVTTMAQKIGIAPSVTPTNFATATLGELAETLEELRGSEEGEATTAAPVVTGAADWVRAWRVDLDERAAPTAAGSEERGAWKVHAPGGEGFAEALRTALEGAGVGTGILVVLPRDCAEDDLSLALTGARTAATEAAGGRFVLVQNGRGAAGLAKTLRLEAPQVRTTVVHTAPEPGAVDRIVKDVAATTGFSEVWYTAEGTRRVPVLRPLPIRAERTEKALGADDVLLVTGGGKGITAECALAVAEDSGARLALLGRSDPSDDAELTANLDRFAERGVTAVYERADVTAAQVEAAVAKLTERLGGPITAILHGSGRNEPAALTAVHPDTLRATLAPKVDGLRHVLDAVDPGRLRLLVALGSIIGRAGLRGEAHYSIANEWLEDLVTRYGAEHPECRTLVLEWSVWSGVGMGERLAVVEGLNRQGITAITPDQGLAMLRRLLADPQTPSTVVISGRTGGIDTVERESGPLPLLRFVDRPLVHYSGVELVVETDLNAGTDPYLTDHLLDGNLLFPAVLGLEAMTQVTAALTGWSEPPTITDAVFARPIVVPPDGTTTIRIAAVRTDDDAVDVVIQSAETGFTAEHFRARLRRQDEDASDGPPEQVDEDLPPVPLDPAAELYGDLLFQGGVFRRLRGYRRAAARDVDAVVEALPRTGWFAGFLPGELLLGDPGVRDTLMHGNQVCVPDATLLPVRIDRIQPAGDRLSSGGELRFCATERSRDGDTYVYDIALRDAAGSVVERWSGLHLRAVRKRDGRGPWPPALLGSYLERSLGDVAGIRTAVVVEPDDPGDETGDEVTTRRRRTNRAVGRALGRPVEVGHRADGRPEIDDGSLSAAHGAGLTLAVVGTGALGCDLEPVAARPAETWRQLLGRHHALADQIAEACDENPDVAATRVWTAMECLRKAGRSADAPIMFGSAERPGWVVLNSGERSIGVLATTVRGDGSGSPVAIAVLAEESR